MIFDTPPLGFSPRFEVSAVLIEYQPTGSVLFLWRHPDKPQGGTWCFPGGKMEDGESMKHAVIRETFEETSIVLDEERVRFVDSIAVTHAPEHGGYSFWYNVYHYVLEAKHPGELPVVQLHAEDHTSHFWWPVHDILRDTSAQARLCPDEVPCLRRVWQKIAAKRSVRE